MDAVFDRTVDLIAEESPATLATALRRGGRLADLFAEDTSVEHLRLTIARGERHETGGAQRIRGVGVRVLDDTCSWYASADRLTAEAVRQAASEVRAKVESPARAPTIRLPGSIDAADTLPADAPSQASVEEKRALLEQAADAAAGLHPSASEIRVDFQGRERRAVVASSDGRLARTARSLVGLRVEIRCGDRWAYAVGGGAGGLGMFMLESPESIAGDAARRLPMGTRAREMKARPRSGKLPVVIAGGWGGVWLHEIVGHLLEADLAVGRFAPERIGRRVAGDLVTVIDDARFAGGRATSRIDDEGTPTAPITLIENGRLSALLTDRRTARRMALPETGNGRRQDYRFEPLPRSSNLLLAAGEADPASLLAEARNGIYVTMIAGGTVRPLKDTFSFDVLEARLLVNGRVSRPVHGLRVRGRASDMLDRVRGIASDFRHDQARGVCEKSGQMVPVSVAMPTVWIDGMIVEHRP